MADDVTDKIFRATDYVSSKFGSPWNPLPGNSPLPGQLNRDSALVRAWLDSNVRLSEGVSLVQSITPAGRGYLIGDDISDWQDVHWDQLPDLDFYVCKATQGVYNVQSTFAVNREQARLRNKPSGIYHFPDWGDPDAEATHFLNVVGTLGPMEFFVFDAEGGGFYNDPAAYDPWIERFCSIVESATGRQDYQSVVYMSDAFAKWMPANTARRRLWDAAYPSSGDPDGWGLGWGSGPWDRLSVWQWTSSGSLDGISGGVDLDVAVLDLAEQLGLQGVTSSVPSTTPEPSPGDDFMATISQEDAELIVAAAKSIEGMIGPFLQEVKDIIAAGGHGSEGDGQQKLVDAIKSLPPGQKIFFSTNTVGGAPDTLATNTNAVTP